MEWIEQSPLAVYQAHLKKGELAYQWSPEAGKAVFYPRVICPFTGSDRLEWRVSAGLGSVYATTVVHPAREGTPYNVALIVCDEGFRLMSRVEEIPPEAVRIGMQSNSASTAPATTSRLIPCLFRWASPDGRTAARLGRDRLRRRKRSRRGCPGHEPDRPDGARHSPRARRLRARVTRCRRAPLRYGAWKPQSPRHSPSAAL